MRILVLSHNYPRFQGDPAGGNVPRLAAAAVEQGNDVHAVAPHAPGAAEVEREGASR